LELYLFFSSCFASSCLPFHTCLFVLFCLLAKRIFCISQTSVQNGCLSSVCLLPLHLGVSGHTRIIHRFNEYNQRNTMPLLLTDCSLSRLPIDPSARHHALLTSSFQFCFQNSHNCRRHFSHICRDVLQALLNAFC